MNRMFKKCVVLMAVCGFAAAVSAQDTEYRFANPVWGKPISNPIYHDMAPLKHDLSVFYMFQSLPSHIGTAGGALQLDGDLSIVAIQLELPLTESLALIANRTGYIDFNPDNTLNKREGFADIGFGLKWAFWQDEMMTWALRTSIELPTGDEDVFQSNGDGSVNPALVGTWMSEDVVLNGTLGAIVPFDSSERSSMGYLSLGYAHRLTNRFSSHVELNYFRVIENGHGEAGFENQRGNAVPQIVEFEGGDLINFGSVNADKHPNFVSLAVGGRFQVSEAISLGLTYELPLTNKEHGLMDNRVTAMLSYSF